MTLGKRLLLPPALTLAGAALLQRADGSRRRHGAWIEIPGWRSRLRKLEQFYESHRYTVTQVVEWYTARIEKYDGIYQAIETRDFKGASTHGRSRRCGSRQSGGALPGHCALWGVPVIVD